MKCRPRPFGPERSCRRPRSLCLGLLSVLFGALVLVHCGDAGKAPSAPPEPSQIRPPKNGQVLMIKADDFSHAATNPGAIPARWITFINFIQRNGLKATIGLEGKSLTTGTKPYRDAVRAIGQQGQIEFYNHGLTHSLEGVDPSWGATEEYLGTPFWFQMAHLALTQGLMGDCLGREPIAFGAPGNAFDQATRDALADCPGIRVWFNGPHRTDKTIVTAWTMAESPAGHPDFDRFKLGYPPWVKVVLLEIHPAAWKDDHDWAEFIKILDFFRERGIRTVTPTEYFEMVNPPE
jgi:hypothetical protein